MLDAVHKNTNVGIYAYEIWAKFTDPYSEEWVCCPICQKKVFPVIGHKRIINEKEVSVVSFFRLQEGIGGCISSESDEHKRGKILIATMVENQSIPLLIGNSEIPYSSLRFKNVPRLPFRWNRTEQTRGKHKADILFELQEWHNILGQGIVFEIQTSDISIEEKANRESDWILNGYSLTWLKPQDFTDDSLTDNKIKIDNVWALKFAQILQRLKEEIFTDLTKVKLERFEHEQKLSKTCRTCFFGSPDKKDETLIACWNHTYWRGGTRRHPEKRELLFSCTDWKPSGELVHEIATATHS